MGHLLEHDMFPAEEVMALKRKYFQNISIKKIYTEEYVYSDGITKKKIILASSGHLIEPYQGRIYVESLHDVVDDKGNLMVEEALERMMEFMSVPISCYCAEPEKLLQKDPVMYEFIERYMK